MIRENKIGRFFVDYKNLAEGIISPIKINKPKKFYIKASWDQDFNRRYIILKEKKSNAFEVLRWTPKKDGSVAIPKDIPSYVEELLYDVYNFEFPHGNEKKDISFKSFLIHTKEDLSKEARALLIKIRMESLLKKRLSLSGPFGLSSLFCIEDKKGETVSKTFKTDSLSISYKSLGYKEEYPEGSIGEANGLNYDFTELELYNLVCKELIK